jgi:hypothetical protein
VRNGKRNGRRHGRSHLAGGLVRRVLPLKRQQRQPHAETQRTRRETEMLFLKNSKRFFFAFSAVKLFYSGRNDAKERAMRVSVWRTSKSGAPLSSRRPSPPVKY